MKKKKRERERRGNTWLFTNIEERERERRGVGEK